MHHMPDHKTVTERKQSTQPAQVVLLELENLAVTGREILWECLKQTLKEKEIRLTPMRFVKHCLAAPASRYVPEIIKEESRTRLSEEKLVAETAEAIKQAFTDKGLKLSAGVKALLAACNQRGAPVGLLSGLGLETAQALSAQLGFEAATVPVMSCVTAERVMPNADNWLKLAKAFRVTPARCVTLTTSADSCRAAVAAGMRVVAIPDEYTGYQDFGGADLIIDELTDKTVDSILSLGERRA
jgi:beta-phosphoglucomutase-like phosphatase (HAD superfamily)